MSGTLIFHAWTTANEPELHRAFVRDCINRAVATLGRDAVEVVDAVRDGGGSATAAAEPLLQAIERADLMIADVTASGADGAPSADVLFELGCRVALTGMSSVILVADCSHRRPSRLPLALRVVRIVSYELGNDARRDTARDQWAFELATAIETCLHDSATERAQRHARGVDALARILVYGTDLDDNPDGARLADDARTILELTREVRTTLAEQLNPEWSDLLDKAVMTLERTVSLPDTIDSWPKIRSGLAAACSNIELGPRELLRTTTSDPSLTRDMLGSVRELARWATEATAQLKEAGDAPISAEQLERFDQLSYELRRMAEFPVLPEHPSFVERLHPIAVSIRKALLVAKRDGARAGSAYIGSVQLARDELTGLLTAYASVLP
ncbi:MAG: hypothetical protein AB7O24_07095 [Kofleriaceae bacterium]